MRPRPDRWEDDDIDQVLELGAVHGTKHTHVARVMARAAADHDVAFDRLGVCVAFNPRQPHLDEDLAVVETPLLVEHADQTCRLLHSDAPAIEDL